MYFLKIVLGLVLLTVCGFAQEAINLKRREPTWRPKILEHFNEGIPKTVIFYEESSEGKEMPVKQLQYYPTGEMRCEMDVIAVEEGSPGHKAWQNTIVPHGACVSLFKDGKVEKIAYFDRGILHGELKLFFQSGKPQIIAYYNQGQQHGKSVAYYESGKKHEEINFENGKITGDLVRYYPTEQRALLIPHVEGVPHGNALEWHGNGTLKTSRRFEKGVLSSDGRNPAVVTYDENRNMLAVQDFQNGQPVGSHIKYYPNGKESYKVRFRDGKMHGTEQFFADDGKLIGEGEYVLGVPKGTHWRNHPNGKSAYSAKYNSEGKLLEPIVKYNEAGQKIAEYYLVDDKYDGDCLEWYDNGQLKTNHHYVNGKYDGEQTEFFSNGQIKVHSFYKDQQRDGTHEEWYENGKLCTRIQYSNGIKNGPAVRFFEDGTQQFDEFFVNDKHDKVQKEWHSNGNLKFQGAFAEGKKEGNHQQWDGRGVLTVDANYKADLPHGCIITYFDANQPLEVVNFKEGKRHGKAEEHYQNGKLKTSAFYKEDKLDGEVKGWYEDGSLRLVKYYDLNNPIKEHKEFYPAKEGEKEGQLARLCHYTKAGEFQGEQLSYYPSGATESSLNYKDGKLDGLKALWTEEGELLEEAWYVNGQLNGRFLEKAPDGREIIFQYKNNRKEGLHEIYYPNNQFFGRVKGFEVNYINDLPEGEAIEYNEAGAKLAITHFKAGKKIGPATIFTDKGKIAATFEFKDDKRNGPSKEYFPNGKLFREVEYINDQKTGEERSYFDNGKLAAIAHYKNGEKHGLYQEWNKEGVLVFEGEFKDGLRHGKLNKYYDDGKPKILQTFIDDRLNGVKKAYDPKGNLSESKYDMGKKL